MHGISHVLLEVDSSILKEAITSDSHDRAPSGMIFSGIRSLLANQFVCLSVSLIPRCTDSSAYELANLSLAWDPGQSCTWTGPLPVSVNVQVIRDLAKSV